MMMLKGSCHFTEKIQSLTQCGLWAPPNTRSVPRNVSGFCMNSGTKRQDLSMSVTTKEVNNNNTNNSNNGVGLKTRSLADKLRLGSMTEDGLSFKESYIIRSYEVGMNKTATVETIANLLQEVGCNHAQGVGFSTDGFATTNTMRKLHLIWVTARMHIEIYKYPAWSDVVELETWCQAEGKIGTRRDFIMKDFATGEVIGRATSKWVMMNMDTRKLERVSPEVADEYLVFCPKEPRLAFPEPNNKSLRKIPKLADPGHYSKLGLVPRRADLDMNQHVNNVTYIGWVLESMPQEIIDTHELSSITLDYRRECQHDDVVDSLTTAEATYETESIPLLNGTNGSPSGTKNKDDSVQFLHLLRLSKDGSEINRGRTEWRRKPQKSS